MNNDEITDKELDELEWIEKSATGGPWERYGYIGSGRLDKVRGIHYLERTGRPVFVDVPVGEVDSKLIAAARNALPRLIATIRALRQRAEPTQPATSIRTSREEARRP